MTMVSLEGFDYLQNGNSSCNNSCNGFDERYSLPKYTDVGYATTDNHQIINEVLQPVNMVESENTRLVQMLGPSTNLASESLNHARKKLRLLGQFADQHSYFLNVAKTTRLGHPPNEMDIKPALDAASFYDEQLYDCYTLFTNCDNYLDSIQDLLDASIRNYEKRQQLAGCGYLISDQESQTFLNSMLAVQPYFARLAQLLWDIREDLGTLCNLCERSKSTCFDKVVAKYNESTKRLEHLLNLSFYVEKQPSQMMKPATRFSTTVRFLLGNELDINQDPPTVHVDLIPEFKAKEFFENPYSKLDNAEITAHIRNNVKVLNYRVAEQTPEATFQGPLSGKIRRTEKKASERVMDEKCCLLFRATIKVKGTLSIKIRALSLPVVIIVHGSQEPKAWGTVLWDNAFSDFGRAPFVVPEEVQWKRVAQVLNAKFYSVSCRSLSKKSLHFLAQKAFRNYDYENYDEMMLSIAGFNRQPLSNSSFTFWEWFYAVLKLTREHLERLWQFDLIHGFVMRKEAEDWLSNQRPGTFLLRFSETQLGAISIACRLPRSSDKIVMLKPLTSKDLNTRKLADRLQDLSELQVLYPNVDKDHAFQEHYTREEFETMNGYMDTTMVTKICMTEGSTKSWLN